MSSSSSTIRTRGFVAMLRWYARAEVSRTSFRLALARGRGARGRVEWEIRTHARPPLPPQDARPREAIVLRLAAYARAGAARPRPDRPRPRGAGGFLRARVLPGLGRRRGGGGARRRVRLPVRRRRVPGA